MSIGTQAVDKQTSEYRNCEMTVWIEDKLTKVDVRSGRELIGLTQDRSSLQAIQKARSLVDTYRESAVTFGLNSAPTLEQYRAAFSSIERWLSPTEKRLLAAHLRSENFDCTIIALQALANCPSSVQLTLIYAGIARRLSDALAYVPSLNVGSIDPIVSTLLAPSGILAATINAPETLTLQPIAGLALRNIDGYRPT